MKLYFDIDTQIDFMFPAGALYVPGAEKLLPRIAQLNREGKVISTTDAHTEDDPEFKQWPPHCVVGTIGQTKPCSLLRDKRVVVPNQPVPLQIEGADQIILEKQHFSLFTNPNTDAIIKALAPDECIVYGVVTEICVKECILGLMERGYKVSVIPDAIQSLNQAEADQFLRDLAARRGTELAS
jgi:nicotinamidase/pyrazinamidase